MIITTKPDIKLDSNKNNTIFTIYNNERIIIQPLEKKIIHLPYTKTIENNDNVKENKNKYLSFQLSKELSLKGLQVLWNNLNEEGFGQFQFLIYNNNIDYWLISDDKNDLSRLTGSREKIDIFSGKFFGKIYII